LEQAHILTRLPKGYEPGNPAEEYLRLKSFAAVHPIGDEELSTPKSAAQAAKHLRRLTPLIVFLNRAVEDTE
jgi:uncharacterized protein (DUF2461 family)